MRLTADRLGWRSTRSGMSLPGPTARCTNAQFVSGTARLRLFPEPLPYEGLFRRHALEAMQIAPIVELDRATGSQ